MGETLYGRTLSGTEEKIRSIRLIILQKTPAAISQDIYRQESFLYAFIQSITPPLKPEADHYIL